MHSHFPIPLSHPFRTGGFLFVLLVLFAGNGNAQTPKAVTPLLQAHSHNDYEHARPLFDALDQGFCSVEADVWLVDGRLLVGHDRVDLKPERTLEALYLVPLRTRIEQNGGRVFRNGPSLTLLIDVKSDATNTYAVLIETLGRFGKILTRFHSDRIVTNAVTIIISGNRARGMMAVETSRLAAYDGRVADLDSGASPNFIPLVSDNWTTLFRWKAEPNDGPMPAAEREKLKALVARTHQQGRRLRLWATPDKPAAWAELFDAGVDLINTDNLEGLSAFLAERRAR